jgi:hypothetical protein
VNFLYTAGISAEALSLRSINFCCREGYCLVRTHISCFASLLGWLKTSGLRSEISYPE